MNLSSPLIRQTDSAIYLWCRRQRHEYRKRNLSEERINLLNSINFIWDIKEEEWQNKFKELKEFYIENCHISPRRSHPSLGTWCDTQRQKYKKGTLSKERIDLLESIGFKWTIR